jgi:hypothetical protein
LTKKHPSIATTGVFYLEKSYTIGTERGYMSFQAYLDSIEQKTGKKPNDFIALAKAKGYDASDVKAGVIVDWLKQDFDLGRGHAMAIVHVIKHGAVISDKHVGTSSVHSDESNTLRLDGMK